MEISEKIKAILGEELADDMTAEQILEKLNGKNVVDLAKAITRQRQSMKPKLRRKRMQRKHLQIIRSHR